MRIKRNHILIACVVALAAACIWSVSRPLRFQRQCEKRETVVKERLLKIRQAEERYLQAQGEYAPDFATLIQGGYLADSLQYVPYSDGEPFDLAASAAITRSGKVVPLMQCGALYHQYLKGLDENSIGNLTEAADAAGRYPGLKIGDLTQDNGNSGNWE